MLQGTKNKIYCFLYKCKGSSRFIINYVFWRRDKHTNVYEPLIWKGFIKKDGKRYQMKKINSEMRNLLARSSSGTAKKDYLYVETCGDIITNKNASIFYF